MNEGLVAIFHVPIHLHTKHEPRGDAYVEPNFGKGAVEKVVNGGEGVDEQGVLVKLVGVLEQKDFYLFATLLPKLSGRVSRIDEEARRGADGRCESWFERAILRIWLAPTGRSTMMPA